MGAQDADLVLCCPSPQDHVSNKKVPESLKCRQVRLGAPGRRSPLFSSLELAAALLSPLLPSPPPHKALAAAARPAVARGPPHAL